MMSLATPGCQELDKGVEVSNSFCFDCHPATEAGCAMGGGVCFLCLFWSSTKVTREGFHCTGHSKKRKKNSAETNAL